MKRYKSKFRRIRITMMLAKEIESERKTKEFLAKYLEESQFKDLFSL